MAHLSEKKSQAQLSREKGMKTAFISAEDCLLYSKYLEEAMDDEMRPETAELASGQFWKYSKEGGDYIANIIKAPAFSAEEFIQVLNFVACIDTKRDFLFD